MVKGYPKGEKTKLSENFYSTDFDCKCTRETCKITYIDEFLVEGLEVLFKIAGSFKVNSGYRCQAHNQEIGGEKNSYHMKGMAADVQSLTGRNGRQMAEDAECVSAFYNGGIGKYTTFAHVDVRGKLARWDMRS